MKSSGKAMHQKRRVISTLHSIKIVTEDVRPCTESALSWPLPTLLDTHHWGVQSQWHPFWSNPVDMCIWCHNFFFLLSFLLKYFLFFFFCGLDEASASNRMTHFRISTHFLNLTFLESMRTEYISLDYYD